MWSGRINVRGELVGDKLACRIGGQPWRRPEAARRLGKKELLGGWQDQSLRVLICRR